MNCDEATWEPREWCSENVGFFLKKISMHNVNLFAKKKKVDQALMKKFYTRNDRSRKVSHLRLVQDFAVCGLLCVFL